MKKAISGGVVVVLGLLIALGPQFLFKVCGHGENGYAHCHWSAQAEIGLGLMIAALGACMIVFNDASTQLGLLLAVFLAGIIALAIPNFLVGGCASQAMKCHRVSFPALTIESIVLSLFSAIAVTIAVMQKKA